MPTDTWKQIERHFAADLGGKRIHSSEKDDEADIRDKDERYWNGELKHRKAAVPSTVRTYVEQAEGERKRGQFAFVIAHTPGTRRDSAYVYMNYQSFKRLMKLAGMLNDETPDAT